MLLNGFYCTITSSIKYLEAGLSMGPHGGAHSAAFLLSLWFLYRVTFCTHVTQPRLDMQQYCVGLHKTLA